MRRRFWTLIGAIVMASGLPAFAENNAALGIFDSMLGYRRRVCIGLGQDLAGTEIAKGLPALVKLSTAISGFDYGDFELPNGGDMSFTDAAGNAIPHEVDTWDPNGVSLVWVKLPSSASGTTVWMFYGNGHSPVLPATDVWSAYVGVWHLRETGGPDSAVTLANSVLNGTAAVTASGATCQSAPGKIGGGWQISDGAADAVGDGGILVKTNVALGTNFAVSAWICHKNQDPVSDCVFVRSNALGDGSGYAVYTEGSSITNFSSRGRSGYVGTARVTNSKDQWIYYAAGFVSTRAYGLCNGGLVLNKSISKALSESSLPIGFGIDSDANGVSWKGKMDELRVKIGYSENYSKAEYMAMNVGATDVFTYGAALPMPSQVNPLFIIMW